jgi:DHA2 family multidrug resistance protein
MIPLVIRGFAMGLLFTPLTTLALSSIPRNKIAQASGLFNVIRQLGGSFGVAFMGAMLTRRTLFHSAMFGQMLDPQSPAFQRAAARLSRFSELGLGSTPGVAAMRAKSLIAAHAAKQAFVQAVCDDFFIAAAISIVGLIPILLLRTVRRKSAERPALTE